MERTGFGLSNEQSLCSGGDKLMEIWRVEVCQKNAKTGCFAAILTRISGEYQYLVT
jgi:hypothetical protein